MANATAPARFESKSGVRLRSPSAPERVAFAAPSESMLQRYDVNGDGMMSRDEAPSRLPDRAFDSFIWPVLGFIFLPWTTLMWVAVAPFGNVEGWDWAWLALGLLGDFLALSSSFAGRRQIPGYPVTY